MGIDAILTGRSFQSYYYNLLKRRQPKLVQLPPEEMTLTLNDGQSVFLEGLYRSYCQQPDKLDELIDEHIELLNFVGDDVPNLTNYQAIKELLFPRILFDSGKAPPPAHRIQFWPGLTIGAVIRGDVFNYGVNTQRLRTWGFSNLNDIMETLKDNLYNIPPVAPRVIRDRNDVIQAITYADHPLSTSFILFEDFYATTVHNLGSGKFLVGLPNTSTLSCFRNNDSGIVEEHLEKLMSDYYDTPEPLTKTIYLVDGHSKEHIRPCYDFDL